MSGNGAPFFFQIFPYTKVQFNNIRCATIVKSLEKNIILLISDLSGVADLSKMRRFFPLAT